MSKRKGSALLAAFAKANQVSAGQKQAPLETIATHIPAVPEEYLQELEKQYSQYRDTQASIITLIKSRAAAQAQQQQEQTTRSRARGGLGSSSSPGSMELDDSCFNNAASANSQVAFARWQAKATYCIRQLSVWAGSSIMVQPALQEYLLHIVTNADLHTDPLLSVQAYRLLQRSLQAHPPASAHVMTDAQPPVLQQNTSVWHPMADATSKDFTLTCLGGKAKFALLQDLVCNAGHIVTGSSSAAAASSSNGSSNDSSVPSQGKALLLLYLTQVLQADCLVRLAAFEQHLRAAAAVRGGTEQQQARERAAVLLQHSFLWRLMEHDGSWAMADSYRGKHHLVRELLRIVASNGGSSSTTGNPPAPAAVSAADAVQPVSPQELVQAARQLLLLLLQLYSNAEQAGVYGGGNGGAGHHAQRGLAARANDRFELDEVMRLALAGGRMLPELQHPAALMRLLQLLPPEHRARLVTVVVAEAIAIRPYDDPVPANTCLQAVHLYCVDRGRGFNSFRRGDALEVMRAMSDRLEWAAREVLGGKDAFAVMTCSLVSAALPGGLVSQQAVHEEFNRLAAGVLQHVVNHSRSRLAKAGAGCSEVVLALAIALQQVGVAVGS